MSSYAAGERIAELQAEVEALRSQLAARPAPPWPRVRGLLTVLARRGDPRIGSRLDQWQAYAADCLDDFGIDVRDDWSLYTTLVAVALVARVGISARESGAISPDTEAELQGLCRALGSALGLLAPAEAAP